MLARAQAQGEDASAFLQARLAPVMLPMAVQCEIAANFALRACYPLAGLAVPPYGEFAANFAGLQARIAHVQGLIGALDPEVFAHAAARTIHGEAGQAHLALPVLEFLLHYALPNFFFHTSMAYAILRHQGVGVGKADFDGYHVY